MSTFDEASLVFIPSGYKTSKAYSVKPTSGDGDLAFTRSNDTATRVGPDGLIEKVRTNVALYSEQFNNAAWAIVGGSSVTANTTTAPDGTLTADTLTVATNNFSGLAQTFTTSTNAWTISLFVKKGTKDFLYLFDPTTTGRAHFNLTTGAVATTVSVTASMTAVGNGWFRCSVTRSITGAAGHYFQFGLSDTDNTILPTSAGTAFIWGAQAEVSDFGATSYIATTTAAVSVGPVANVPRLDYLNSSCPRLLLEPQRTNILQYSEQLDNAYWTKSAAGAIAANQAISPDGTTSADKWTPNAGTAYASFENSSVSTTIGVTYTTSFFAKASGYKYAQLVFDGGDVSANPAANFDLQTGTVTRQDSGITASMVSYGSGWYRCIATFVAASTAFQNVIAIVTDPNASRAQSTTYNGTDSVLFWGLQMEAGAYATSYIPTLGSASTRAADSASKTGISSLIGQTEGTLFAEFVHNGADILTTQSVISVNSGNTQNFVNIGVYDGQLNPAVQASSANIFDLFAGPNPLPAGTHKVAIAYKSGSFAIYLDGSSVYTNASAATFGTMGQTDIGTFLSFNTQLGEGVKQALLFKTRLTNADLAALTA